MSGKTISQKKCLVQKACQQYYEHYTRFIEECYADFSPIQRLPINEQYLANGARRKRRHMTLNRSRVTYIREQFQNSIDTLFLTLKKRYEQNTISRLETHYSLEALNSFCHIKSTNKSLAPNDLDAKKLIAVNHIYHLLNKE